VYYASGRGIRQIQSKNMIWL